MSARRRSFGNRVSHTGEVEVNFYTRTSQARHDTIFRTYPSLQLRKHLHLDNKLLADTAELLGLGIHPTKDSQILENSQSNAAHQSYMIYLLGTLRAMSA